MLIPVAAGILYPAFHEGVPEGLHWLLGEFGFLNPMLAGAAMALSSVSVMANSLRLRGFRGRLAGAAATAAATSTQVAGAKA